MGSAIERGQNPIGKLLKRRGGGVRVPQYSLKPVMPPIAGAGQQETILKE